MLDLHDRTRLLLWAVVLANISSRGWSQQQQKVPIWRDDVTDYVTLPPEYSSITPERLCFSATELALCVSDKYARRCILKDAIVLDPKAWPQFFTNGIPELRPEQRNLTISSDVCSPGGACRSGANSTALQSLDFNFVPGLVLINPGASLTLSHVQFTNLANASAYTYSDQQPYRAVGRGSAMWPSFGLAPNSTLSLVNSSLPYISPSANENCSSVTEKAWFSIKQIWDNGTQLDNATTIRVMGPVTISVLIVNGSTNVTLGNATVIVANMSLVCMPNTTGTVQDSGDNTRTLAIAIAVPVGAVLLLGGLLALVYCIKRRQGRQQHKLTQAAEDSAHSSGKDSPALSADIENDAASGVAGGHATGRDQDKPALSKDVASRMAVVPLLPQFYGLHPTQHPTSQPMSAAHSNGHQQNAATQPQNSGMGVQGTGTLASAPVPGPNRQGSADVAQAAQLALRSHGGVPPTVPVPPGYGASSSSSRAAPAILKARLPVRPSRSFRGSVGQGAGAGGESRGTQAGNATVSSRAAQPAAVHGSRVNGQDTKQHAAGQGQPHSSAPSLHVQRDSGGVSASGGTHNSSGGHSTGGGDDESGVPGASINAANPVVKYDLSILKSSARSSRYGIGTNKSSRINDRLDSLSSLLKARSDEAVLRDLRIGPLLGRGSYGRVYKGRWKASSVAVKVIEHRAGNNSKGVSAGREELLAATSHPNVVKCYHISTMSSSQRAAMAVSWLEDSHSSETATLSQQPDNRRAGSAHSSNSDEPESPPEMLETGIVMEFCEKGSIARAIKLGKFNRGSDGVGLVGMYKALLDTASGLDYLHSIGVVHGDLKTANVLLKGSTRDARGVTCKITDFGLSRVLDMDASHINTGTYGTVAYMPKELLLSGRMTQATDIYSFGLMMWELFTADQVMNEGLSIGQMFYMIAYQDWRPDVPADCPPEFAELMTACWHEDPQQRPDAQQLLSTLQKLFLDARQQHAAVSKAAGSVPGKAGRGTAEEQL